MPGIGLTQYPDFCLNNGEKIFNMKSRSYKCIPFHFVISGSNLALVVTDVENALKIWLNWAINSIRQTKAIDILGRNYTARRKYKPVNIPLFLTWKKTVRENIFKEKEDSCEHTAILYMPSTKAAVSNHTKIKPIHLLYLCFLKLSCRMCLFLSSLLQINSTVGCILYLHQELSV